MSRWSPIFKLLYATLLVWGALYVAYPHIPQSQKSETGLEDTYVVSPASDFLSNQFIQPVDFTISGASNWSKDSGPRFSLATHLKSLLKKTPTVFVANFVSQDNNRCKAVSIILFPFHEFW